MKSVKLLSLALAIVFTVPALSSSVASATELYRASGTVAAGTGFFATLEPGSTVSLASTSEEPITTCTASTMEGIFTNAGGSTTTVSGPVSSLTFTGSCSVTVFQEKNGTLELHHIVGTTNGTVTGTGFYWTVHSPFATCNYGLGTGKHDLGTLTGKTSGNATMHINSIVTEQEPKTIICPDTARWIGKYEFTSPTPLWVEAS